MEDKSSRSRSTKAERDLGFAHARMLRLMAAGAVASALVADLTVVLEPGAAATTPPSAASSATTARAACDPKITFLPPLPGDAAARADAISDHGLVVGESIRTLEDYDTSVVLWRDTGPPISVIAGGAIGGGISIDAYPADVNEHGAVAANTMRLGRGWVLREVGWVWRDGVITRLRGTRRFPGVGVNALNDHGVAVGYIENRHSGGYAAAWRHGHLIRLPRPANVPWASAEAINDRGVIVGRVSRGDHVVGWWWRLGGRNGPLRALHHGLPDTSAIDIDNRSRIVGDSPKQTPSGWASNTVLWRRPRMMPRPLHTRHRPEAMDDDGHLIGNKFVHDHNQPWIARLHGAAARLPRPPIGRQDGADVEVYDIAKGVTALAPQGGVTVVGDTEAYDPNPTAPRPHATVWTCSQKYLK